MHKGLWGAHASGVLVAAFCGDELFRGSSGFTRPIAPDDAGESSLRQNAATSTLQACAPQNFGSASSVHASASSDSSATCFGRTGVRRLQGVAACFTTRATRVTYLVVNRLKRAEGIDVYDRVSIFNPFAHGSRTEM